MNLIKNKKKRGFTLIEMVAVVAIIGILAAILVPKISAYMTEAKKTGVIDEARKVVQAYETVEMKEKAGDLTNQSDLGTITEAGSENPAVKMVKEYLGITDNALDYSSVLKRLPGTITVEQCAKIADGTLEFDVNKNGVLTTYK